MPEKIWILTKYYDDYDQYGGYFLAAFKNEPTEDDLKQFGYSYFGHQKYDQSWVEKDLEEVYSGKETKLATI